jgi:hypothetical protein
VYFDDFDEWVVDVYNLKIVLNEVDLGPFMGVSCWN